MVERKIACFERKIARSCIVSGGDRFHAPTSLSDQTTEIPYLRGLYGSDAASTRERHLIEIRL
jgi:hypothetical protein